MSSLRAGFWPLGAALLLTACVAKDPGWLGGLESDDAIHRRYGVERHDRR